MLRPRLKRAHRPQRVNDELIRIGGRVHGIAAEIKDPDGWVWALLTALDGTRTVDQVVAHLVHRFPQLSERDVRDGVAQMAEAGYLTDAAATPPPELTTRDLTRHSRSRALFEWIDLTPREHGWHPQLRLREAEVVIVGLGGTGSAAAHALAASGVGRLHCVEPDTVELSNLNRQSLYSEKDIGRPKIAAALERLSTINSDIAITGSDATVTGPETIADLIRGFDLLVLCADQPQEIRAWANKATRENNTPWVYGGYHGPQVTAGIYVPGTGPCYDCLRTQHRRRDNTDVQDWPGADEEPLVHPANAISAGISGNLVAHLAISLITGAPRIQANHVYGFNLARPDHAFALSAPHPDPECPACEGQPRP